MRAGLFTSTRDQRERQTSRIARRLTAAGFPIYGERSWLPGILKVLRRTAGLGFIRPDDDGNDVFVHVSAAEPAGVELWEGMRLGFDMETDRKTGKSRAGNLRLL
jgi:cold shock protein